MADMELLDPRFNAYREDLADERLKEMVSAERYIPGDDSHVHMDSVPLFKAPSFDEQLQTEALYGEAVRLFEIRDGWGWGQLISDGYVGYIPLDGLSPGYMAPTHKITALRSFIYSEADIKSPPVALISMLASLNVVDERGEFYELMDSTYVHKAHVGEIGQVAFDFVSVAEQFIGTPYLWGGRTSLGIDCSALVQISLASANFDAPRDSDVQESELGTELIDRTDLSQLRRGDIVFWRGHVGIMVDEKTLLHANAFHMQVAAEPLAEIISRVEASGGGEITALKRIDGYKGGAV